MSIEKKYNTELVDAVTGIPYANIYFIGIGGIGMSALARYFSCHKKNVAGYDKVSSPLTSELSQSEIDVVFKDDVVLIPELFKDKEATLVVYTPAIPSENTLLNYFKDKGFRVLKRAEVLGLITQSSFCLAVAGTHGKTTTSSILGHIMHIENATSFLGGIAENYKSNLILGGDKISVVEADEFDRSFLHLSPDIACITSMDADHLDIYGEHQELINSFQEFAGKANKLVVAKGLDLEGMTYAISEDADYKAYNLIVEEGAYVFDVKASKEQVSNIIFHLPGRHNVMNALAALAMAHIYGVSLDVIKERLATFKGVERRFSYRLKTKNKVLVDDYAHHPVEIAVVCDSVKEMYPNEKVLAVFQPHLFSRTKSFVDDFAKELSKFDEVLLLPIYPARELPVEGVTSEWLMSKMTNQNKKIITKENLSREVLKSTSKIILMLGAGDVGLLVDGVEEALISGNY